MRKIITALVGALLLALPITVWTASSQAASAGTTTMPMPSSSPSPSLGPPDNPGTLTTTARYGPYTLAAGSMTSPSEAALDLPKVNLVPPCTGCDITSLAPNMVYADGSTANMDTGPMLHHLVVARLGVPDLTCPLATGLQRMWSSGNERSVTYLPSGYGLPVAANERWILATDLMNYASQTREVYITITATYVPGTSLKPVIPAWFDPTGGCGIAYYNVPAGPSHLSWTWTSTMDGKIVQMVGHMHGGGLDVSVTDVTTSTRVCDSVATPGKMLGMDEIMHMAECVGDPLAVIHKGDQVRIDAFYDPTTPRTGVMGLGHMMIAPDDGQT